MVVAYQRCAGMNLMVELEPATTSVPVSRTAPASDRLDAIDFFRGLALSFVLLDHCDWSAGRDVFRRWTPIGLGFSDGAEAFVFLSGLTFGWVYSPRLQRDGLWRSEVRVLRRVAQIYLGYVVCVLLVTAFSRAPIEMLEFSRNPLRVGSEDTLAAALLRSLKLQQFPFGLGILGFYIVVLPLMLPLLSLAQRAWWGALALSMVFYVAVPPPLRFEAVTPGWFSEWPFHPSAWQLLCVVGMLIGSRLRQPNFVWPRKPILATLAGLIVLYGLISTKLDMIAAMTGWADPQLWTWFDLSQSCLIAKPRLGPLRIVHFAAVAYLIAYCLPIRSKWNSPWPRPVVNTGRHSLTLYCCGTLMVFAAAVPFYWFGTSPAAVLIIGLDACLLQFLLAWWLEGRSKGAKEQRDRMIVPGQSGSQS